MRRINLPQQDDKAKVSSVSPSSERIIRSNKGLLTIETSAFFNLRLTVVIRPSTNSLIRNYRLKKMQIISRYLYFLNGNIWETCLQFVWSFVILLKANVCSYIFMNQAFQKAYRWKFFKNALRILQRVPFHVIMRSKGQKIMQSYNVCGDLKKHTTSIREVLTWANYNSESEQRQAAWQLASSAGKYSDERERAIFEKRS